MQGGVYAGSPRDRTLNSGRLAQPCFWHFVGQRALEHLLGWEREGYANCTLVPAEAAKKGACQSGYHQTAQIASVSEDVEKGKHYTLFLGMKIAAVIMRQCEVSEKV